MRFKSRVITCSLFFIIFIFIFLNYLRKYNSPIIENFFETPLIYENLSSNYLIEANADIKTEDLMNKIDKDIKKLMSINDFATNQPLSFKKLKIFVVPHSHCDPGWHKTIDGYFIDQVSQILTNAVNKLARFKTMTFVWAETIFLAMWWKNANSELRNKFKSLVESGRLEIVSGGWVIPDEASPHYFALIDQMIEGHSWLYENLNFIPNVSWSLDPFGYSSFISYLHKLDGFSASVILRVHKDIKNELQNRRALEFYWRQPWDHAKLTDIFTLLMPYMLYNIKHTCGPNTNICLKFDFRRIPGEMSEAQSVPITDDNVKQLAELLIDQYRIKASLYKHNIVLVPIGDDFRYDRDIEWDQQYTNYKKLFDYINTNFKGVSIQFGTPSNYFTEVSKSKHISYPSLIGDFFPYTDHDNEYWTGYFTTRPYAKILSRDLEIFLRAADILFTYCHAKNIIVGNESQILIKQLQDAHRRLGYFQHHDAITGTSVSFVHADYIKNLYAGITLVKESLKYTFKLILNNGERSNNLAVRILGSPMSLNLELQENIIPVKNVATGSRLHLFNPATIIRESHVKIFTDSPQCMIFSEKDVKVACQITHRKEYSNLKQIDFIAKSKPYQINNYLIKVDTSGCEESVVKYYTQKDEDFYLKNEFLSVKISSFDGQINSIKLNKINTTYTVKSQLMFYSSKKSGAYIFTPNGLAHPVTLPNDLKVEFTKGLIFSEVRVNMGPVIIIYRLINSNSLEANAIHIDIISTLTNLDDDKEYILRLNSKIKSNNFFYTDQNGHNFVRRIRQTHLPIEANYFPSSSALYIEDSMLRMTLVLSQPHGATSHASGAMEVMLDRRLKYDDGRGLGQGIQDNMPIHSRMYLILEYVSLESKFFEEEKIRSQKGYKEYALLSPPTSALHKLIESLRNFYIISSSTEQTVNELIKTGISLFPKLILPSGFEIINFRYLRDSEFLLIIRRVLISNKYFINTSQKTESQNEFQLSVKLILYQFNVNKIEETNLSGSKLIRKIHINETLVFEPMQIRVFKIYLL